jgi:hypothetical protein
MNQISLFTFQAEKESINLQLIGKLKFLFNNLGLL